MIRRRKYLIKPGFQLRYAGIILLTLFVASAICVLTTYFSSISLLGEKLAHVYPQGRLVATLKQVNMIIAYRLLFLIPFLAFFGILLSHRIAGPAYRIERTLREIGTGNFDIHIKLRRYDELVSIANAINDMTSDLKKLPLAEKKGNET
ncbi:MAG: HAMP domain-containing protein [Candidatus Omnitrophota bacterium]